MAFRPMREEEKKIQLEKIAEAKERVARDLTYLHDLEHDLEKGVWESAPVDPARAAVARERLAKIKQGESLEHFKEFKVGDKVKHIFYSETGIVIHVEDYTTASEGCTPFGPTVIVSLDGMEEIGMPPECYRPEYLEIVTREQAEASVPLT